MPVSVIKDLDTPASAGMRYFEHELLDTDFVPSADLHRDERHRDDARAGDERATRAQLALPRAPKPAGLGPELRLLFGTGTATWAMSCDPREAGDPDYSDDELAWLRAIAPLVGRGLRAALARPIADPQPAWSPGTPALTGDGKVEYATGDAERWLEEMPAQVGYQLPLTRARGCATSRGEGRWRRRPRYQVPAQARVRVSLLRMVARPRGRAARCRPVRRPGLR